jgi:hypothetical protein
MMMTDYLGDQSSMHRVTIGNYLAVFIFIIVAINFIITYDKIFRETIMPWFRKIKCFSATAKKYTQEQEPAGQESTDATSTSSITILTKKKKSKKKKLIRGASTLKKQ